MKVVTRFAPSPTGLLHLGNYRTALFAYIYARQNGGKFILRIEDTDKARSKKEYEDNILESLSWLGLSHDDFFRQSEQVGKHSEALQKLIDSGHAYISKETPKEEGGRTEVIRFKNPNKKVSFNDIIRGRIEFDTTDLGDFIIAKNMQEPVFHLAVVVDDMNMGVTHIIRGEDHISNTPRHILIYEALGAPVPQYAHIPLVLSTDRSKLSKRRGALPITEYRDRGYLPQALINSMVLLGWNPGTDQEILSLEEIVSQFKLEKVQKAGAVFGEEKLQWINKKYIEMLSLTEFTSYAESFAQRTLSPQVIQLLKERIVSFGEIPGLIAGELSFVEHVENYTPDALLWKKEPDREKTKSHLQYILTTLSSLTDFSKESVKTALWSYAEKEGRGNVLWPMRYALSGKEKSPDPFIISEILGKEETLKRLTHAYESL